MQEPIIANEYAQFDILVEVQTLCRKNRSVTWADLIDSGISIPGVELGEQSKIIQSFASANAKLGYFASYMAPGTGYMYPSYAEAILPKDLTGPANGLGRAVLVGRKEGGDTLFPLVTVAFEFSQNPGEKIKVSMDYKDYVKRELELREAGDELPTDVISSAQFLKICEDAKKFHEVKGYLPALYFNANHPEETLRGKTFSFSYREYFNGGDPENTITELTFRSKESFIGRCSVFYCTIEASLKGGPVPIIGYLPESSVEPTRSAVDTLLKAFADYMDKGRVQR